MENAPIIVLTAINISPEAGERYDKWWDSTYGPLYVKNTGTRAIDRYRLLGKNIELPGTITVFHHENLGRLKERASNPDRLALVNDQQTWPIDWYQISVYRLMRSFRSPAFLTGNVQDTIVEHAPVVYIEGYEFPIENNEKFANWFARWASRLYVPMLLKDTGVKCVNFFSLLDYKLPLWENVRIIGQYIHFISILYFENVKNLEEYKEGVEYAIFKRSLETEVSMNLKTVWGSGYQLLNSYRPQKKP
jgi:hypothetical protein